MFLPTLYSRRSDGVTIQVYQMEVEGEKYRTHVGVQDGAITTSAWTVCKGKNAGRANETTPEAQALSEAQSRWQKKMNEKYSDDITKIDSDRLLEPMRANEFKDRVNKIFDERGYPKELLFAQPKFDGVRCKWDKNGPVSRKGKPFFAYPHLVKALQPLFDNNPDLILDGEFYNHELKGDFERIVSLVKKQSPTADEIKDAEAIQYHIYDLPSSPNKFSTRNSELASQWYLMNYSNNPVNHGLTAAPIQFAETVLISSKQLLDEMYEKWLDAGYEGQMVRTDTVYEWKRTNALLKRKEFIDAEFIITGIFEGEGNKSGMAGYVTLGTLDGKQIYAKNGEPARANIKASWAFCKRLLKDKDSIIGQQGTVTFFRYNSTGAPYLPRLIAVRDYE